METADAIRRRRAVRKFDTSQPLDSDRVRNCLQLAHLSPSSSNLQLYEMYHITDPHVLHMLRGACLSQGAALTAREMVVFVVRSDLYRQRARSIFDLSRRNLLKTSPQDMKEKRIEKLSFYYTKLIPFLYVRFGGVLGVLRRILVELVGLFRPIVREVTEGAISTVAHKSCAMAAQSFMLAMTGEGYDTCPMEGFDSKLVRRVLGLSAGVDINMVVACGIGLPEGVWGDRVRLDFNQVYRRL